MPFFPSKLGNLLKNVFSKKYLRKLLVFSLLSLNLYFSPCVSYAIDEDSESKAKSLAAYIMGVSFDLQGLTDVAIEEFEKAAEYYENYAVHLRIGAGYARLGKLSLAIKELELVLDSDPNNVQARYLLALIYSTQKEFDKAADQYESILTSFSNAEPDNVEIYSYLGQLYYSQKQYEKAIKQFEVIRKVYPDNTDVLFLLGSLYLEIGNKEKAVELFKRVIIIDPDHDTSLNSLGYIYAEEGGDLDEAQEFIKRALEISPDNGAYLDSLGWVLYKKGKFKEALRYLLEADSMLKDPVIYEHLGDVYYKLNETDNARKYWNESLELLPEQDHILKKLEALE